MWSERYTTSLPRDHTPCSIYCLSRKDLKLLVGLKSFKRKKNRLGFLNLKRDAITFERLLDLDGTSHSNFTPHKHNLIQSNKHSHSGTTRRIRLVLIIFRGLRIRRFRGDFLVITVFQSFGFRCVVITIE